jgi:hypothetical protein
MHGQKTPAPTAIGTGAKEKTSSGAARLAPNDRADQHRDEFAKFIARYKLDPVEAEYIGRLVKGGWPSDGWGVKPEHFRLQGLYAPYAFHLAEAAARADTDLGEDWTAKTRFLIKLAGVTPDLPDSTDQERRLEELALQIRGRNEPLRAPQPKPAPLEPDRDQFEIFIDAIFRHASPVGIVSLRAFHEEDNPKPFRVTATPLSGDRKFLIDAAEDDARRAANFPKPIVFCPPLATFSNKDRAREKDIAEGLALSVEYDQRPLEAVAKLEQILGRPTVVVASGGKWADPASGQVHDKLHLHWRLRRPATGEDVALLKQARDLAARLVGGDPSNKPVCHPIRWPGSWHRKAEPVMCLIEESHSDRCSSRGADCGVAQGRAQRESEAEWRGSSVDRLGRRVQGHHQRRRLSRRRGPPRDEDAHRRHSRRRGREHAARFHGDRGRPAR